jgi:hypothetical protein
MKAVQVQVVKDGNWHHYAVIDDRRPAGAAVRIGNTRQAHAVRSLRTSARMLNAPEHRPTRPVFREDRFIADGKKFEMLYLELLIQGLIYGCMYAIIAVGLALVYGLLRILHVAHAGLFVLGGYLGLLITNATGSLIWPCPWPRPWWGWRVWRSTGCATSPSWTGRPTWP